MQRAGAGGAVEGVTQRLAVDGHQLATGGGLQGLDPAREAALEGLRVEESEDAAEGVATGDAVGQRQQCFEPVAFLAAAGGDLDLIVAAVDDSTDGDGDEVEESMQAAALAAWSGQEREVGKDRGGVAGMVLLRDGWCPVPEESFARSLVRIKEAVKNQAACDAIALLAIEAQRPAQAWKPSIANMSILFPAVADVRTRGGIFPPAPLGAEVAGPGDVQDLVAQLHGLAA